MIPFATDKKLPIGENMPSIVIGIPNGFELKSINEKVDDFCTVTLSQNGVDSEWHVDYAHGTSALSVIYPAAKESVQKMVDRRMAKLEADSIRRRAIYSSVSVPDAKPKKVATEFSWIDSTFIIVSMVVVLSAGILIGASL